MKETYRRRVKSALLVGISSELRDSMRKYSSFMQPCYSYIRVYLNNPHVFAVR